MTDNTETTPLTPYQQRMRKITAAMKAMMEEFGGSGDPAKEAQTLVSYLDDEDLQILPRCPSYARWRVVVDGQPAPANNAPGRESGPLDADETAEAFLRAALNAEDERADTRITVRPASDEELVAMLTGDTSLLPEPVVARVTALAQISRGDLKVLRFVGADHTVVEAEFDPEQWAMFVGGMAEEDDAADG